MFMGKRAPSQITLEQRCSRARRRLKSFTPLAFCALSRMVAQRSVSPAYPPSHPTLQYPTHSFPETRSCICSPHSLLNTYSLLRSTYTTSLNFGTLYIFFKPGRLIRACGAAVSAPFLYQTSRLAGTWYGLTLPSLKERCGCREFDPHLAHNELFVFVFSCLGVVRCFSSLRVMKRDGCGSAVMVRAQPGAGSRQRFEDGVNSVQTARLTTSEASKSNVV